MIAHLYIQSDAGVALARMERFVRDLPMTMSLAFQPRDWLPLARQTAEDTLMLVAKSAEQQVYVPQFVRLVMLNDLGLGMEWTMGRPPMAGGINVASAARLLQLGELFAWGASKDAEQLMRLVQQWVATEKVKDARDAGRSDSQIAGRLLRVIRCEGIQSPVPGTVRGSAQSVSNAGGLLRHLQDFADRAKDVLTEAEVNEWMEAVLAAWSELALAHVPRRLMKEIAQSW